jgi:hypothetical protein
MKTLVFSISSWCTEDFHIASRFKINLFFSMGLNVGFINDQGRYSEVKTVVPGDLQFAADVNKMLLPNAGFGLYYYSKEFYAGFSIPKLIQNDVSPAHSNGVQNNIGKVSAVALLPHFWIFV